MSDALPVTINYTGGSVTMPIGNARSLFGNDGFEALRPQSEQVTVSVRGHTRTNVIGGPSREVLASSYTYTKWPRSRKSRNAGGTEVLMAWENSQGTWSARITGSAAQFATFLNDTAPVAVRFETKGSKYGPFVRSAQ